MATTSTRSAIREFDRVADRVRQHRQVDDRPVVLVEGPDDLLVLRPHLAGVAMFASDGKVNLLAGVTRLEEYGQARIVGVIDRDFDGTEKNKEDSDLIYPYEGRDLEWMLVRLGVLATVLEHQGSATKLAGLGGAQQLIARLLATVGAITNIRAANALNSWGLPFDDVPIQSKVAKVDLVLNLNGYVAALTRRQDLVDLRRDVLDASERHPGDAYGARGRDVVEVAGVALRRLAGTLAEAAATESLLSRQLRSSAGLALSQSDWLAGLKDRLGLAGGGISGA